VECDEEDMEETTAVAVLGLPNHPPRGKHPPAGTAHWWTAKGQGRQRAGNTDCLYWVIRLCL
jgi:hypothetical protein